MNRRDEIREKALRDLQQFEVLMINGHFDFGNGYHGRVYLNPHQLFRHPSTIWRFAQDLLDVLPGSILDDADVVAGPLTGGALLAHTMAGLLDSRRHLTRPPMLFAPFSVDVNCGQSLSRFYEQQVKGRKVLIVDDDIRNIFAMTSLLEPYNMSILSAETGRSAIELLQDNTDVDVVLMDIMMPDMDGYDTMRAIRKLAKFRSLPIIALTAKAMKGDRERCIEAGASDYISKPVDTEQLLALLRMWLYR